MHKRLDNQVRPSQEKDGIVNRYADREGTWIGWSCDSGNRLMERSDLSFPPEVHGDVLRTVYYGKCPLCKGLVAEFICIIHAEKTAPTRTITSSICDERG